MGVGECAGEVVSLIEFDLAAAEELVFEAQVHLDEKEYGAADEKAYAAMLQAAKGLVKTQFLDIPDDPGEIVREFRTRFYDTELFFDKYAGGKFAQYLFRRQEEGPSAGDRGATRQSIEEANLFVEAARSCQMRLAGQTPAAASGAGNIVTLEL